MSSFATSYIPTTTASATRSADSALMNGTNFSSWYNQTQGTFVVEFDKKVAAGQSGIPFMVNNGTVANRIYTNGGVLAVDDASAPQASVTAGTVVDGVVTKFAAAYSANDFNCAFNGTLAATPDTSGTVPAVSQINFGASVSGTGSTFIDGHIRRIQFFPVRLSNATLQALTS